LPIRRERPDRSVVEGRQIVGLTARHQGPALRVGDDDRLVGPLTARVADIGPQARPARQRLALDYIGLDQRPRRMTDGRDRFALIDKAFDEGNSIGIEP
jgi:hypothetical protein